MNIKPLILESRKVIDKLKTYYEGTEHLTLRQFDRLLNQAQDLIEDFDLEIDGTSRSQDTLLNMRDQLEHVVADGSFKMDKFDDDAYEISGNHFSMFGGASVRDEIPVDFPVDDFNLHNNFQ